MGERLRAELMALLMRGGVRDPAVRDTVVTAVRINADLRNARVYVRLMEASPSAARQAALLRGLGRATPFIRRELSPKLALKYQPELKFYWDDGLDEAVRIESLLDGIRQENQGGVGADASEHAVAVDQVSTDEDET